MTVKLKGYESIQIIRGARFKGWHIREELERQKLPDISLGHLSHIESQKRSCSDEHAAALQKVAEKLVPEAFAKGAPRRYLSKIRGGR